MEARSESSLTRGAIFTFGWLPRALALQENRRRERERNRCDSLARQGRPFGSRLRPGILELRDSVSATRYTDVRWKFSASHPERHRYRIPGSDNRAHATRGTPNLPPLIVRESLKPNSYVRCSISRFAARREGKPRPIRMEDRALNKSIKKLENGYLRMRYNCSSNFCLSFFSFHRSLCRVPYRDSKGVQILSR